jgi:hypothetical protein
MTPQKFDALEDVTPWFEAIDDGSGVLRTVLRGHAGAIFQKEDDGIVTDGWGRRWITGWVGERHVRRRVSEG